MYLLEPLLACWVGKRCLLATLTSIYLVASEVEHLVQDASSQMPVHTLLRALLLGSLFLNEL